MQNLFVTSDITADELQRLAQRVHVRRGGWGLTGTRLTPEELVAAAAEAHILLVGYESLPAWAIEALPNLQLIGCTRSTPVNIDLAAATRRRIPVLHAPGRNTQTAAEFTFGLILSEAHRIARSNLALHRGHYLGAPRDEFATASTGEDITWKLDGESPFKDFRGIEVAGRTLGIIGLGKIGSQVAKLAQAFGMEVRVYSPYTSPEEAGKLGVTLASLENVLRHADFITLHARVAEGSRGMIGAREIAWMKPEAYLINTARAALIDQAALIAALQERRIAGAALDVFWYEPLPANHPLLQLENVTLTPHLAGATADVQARHSRMVVSDVLAWLDGKRPAHVANPEVWDR